MKRFRSPAPLFVLVAGPASAAAISLGLSDVAVDFANPDHFAAISVAAAGSGTGFVSPDSITGLATVPGSVLAAATFAPAQRFPGPLNDLFNGAPRFDESTMAFVTGPTGTGAQFIRVTLRNDSGFLVTGLEITYRHDVRHSQVSGSGDGPDLLRGLLLGIPGGFPGDLMFSTLFPPAIYETGNANYSLSGISISPGEEFVLHFMDDNGPASGTSSSRSEGVYALQNLSVAVIEYIPEPAVMSYWLAAAAVQVSGRRHNRSHRRP